VSEDNVFVKNVSLVIVILVVLTFSIAFLAGLIGSSEPIDSNNPSRATHIIERIKPVADAYTGDSGMAAISEASAPAKKEVTAAFDGSLDGEMIYNNVCTTCHSTGVAGAPKPGSPEMAARAEKGADALLQSALNGLNAMPARGGRADLSDEQIQAVIDFMTK